MKDLINWFKTYRISRKRFLLSSFFFLASAKLRAEHTDIQKEYFKHGVASGDPLQDKMIIWTRISSKLKNNSKVIWEIAATRSFEHILNSGTYSISEKSDFTVKVDVGGLKPDSVYYYRFRYLDTYSNIGKTKTLPSSLTDQSFQLAVVSCNNYEAGYFNSYRFLSQKEDVDAILHLGDYIYEYESGRYGDISIGRIHDPLHEILTLSDYRKRYALYRSDPDLQKLHENKPFFMVWDDHEFANGAYGEGAQNHSPEEGEWKARKRAAIQAYFEWLPVRAISPAEMSKKINIGSDVELYLLDERMSGKTKQFKVEDPEFYDLKRTLLGHHQYQWLAESLKKSKAKWKFIANQVMITGYTAPEGDKRPTYNDWWVGYPHERKQIMNLIEQEKIENVVFLTGDHHKAFVLALHPEEEFLNYTKSYKEKPLAWELLTPSITSRNASHLPKDEVSEMEEKLYRRDVNPHVLYADIKAHGYYIATISPQQFQADYYYIDNLRSRIAEERKAASFVMDAETFKLKPLNTK